MCIDANKGIDNATKEVIKRLNNLKSINQHLGLFDEYSNEKSKMTNDQFLIELQKTNELLKKKKEFPISKVLILNKIDLCANRFKLKWLQQEIQDLGKFDNVMFVSTETQYGISELKEYLHQNAVKKLWKYPSNVKTNLSLGDRLR